MDHEALLSAATKDQLVFPFPPPALGLDWILEFVTAVSCSTTDLEDLVHSWNILMKHEVMSVVVPIGVVEDTPMAL